MEYLRLKQGEHPYKPIEEYLSQFKTFPVLLSEEVEGEEGTNVYEDEIQEMGEKWKVKVKFFWELYASVTTKLLILSLLYAIFVA